MKRDKNRYASWMAFVDFLFNYTIAFSFLFIVAFMMIRPQSNSEAQVKAKAEFILTMTWPDEAFDDIDLWLQLPSGEKVWYNHKNAEFATLDRDDLGAPGDLYRLHPSDPTDLRKGLIKLNREVITLRAIVPGRYVAAAHVYNVHDTVNEFTTKQKLPYDAKLEIQKINPRVMTVANSVVSLQRVGQSSSFVAFTIDENGDVTSIEQNPNDSIIELKPHERQYLPGEGHK
jgi:hypothetical protein